MTDTAALEASALCWRCDTDQFDFQTTDQLADLVELLGQARAVDAVRFGIGIRREGYNLYVLGPPGMGKRSLVSQFLQQKTVSEPTPPDWCYVNDFDRPHQPRALQLPAGRGVQLHDHMEQLVDDLRTAIPAALESEEHRGQRKEVEQQFKQQHEELFNQLVEKAHTQGLDLLRTPGGFALAPMHEGEVISPEDYDKLTAEEKKRIEAAVGPMQEELKQFLEQVPGIRKELHDRVKALNREAIQFATGDLMKQLKRHYADLPEVSQYLNSVEQHVIDHADQFRPREEEPAALLAALSRKPSFELYTANLLVDNSQTHGAPLVHEDHPTYQNLVGRVEHESEMGSLVTNFSLIKSGALHRANGGYLVVEARKLLMQTFAWEGLKRCLQSRNIKIESLGQALSLISTVSLEPEPIPLDAKVVLLGDRMLYYLLYQHDPDFAELFKVAADFDERIDTSPENCQLFARFLATQARSEKLRPLAPGAVARVLEHSARMAGDAEKLSTHMRTVSNLLHEADYWAAQDGVDVVAREQVQQAIDQQIYRADRMRERVLEQYERGTVLVDTEGQEVGQVNGLSVIDLGNFRFGRPARITATARLGKGEVVDIEREVELGGAIHSKGVLILSAFLASRYAQEVPLTLRASLVFEQSYGLIDGDSAAVGELCALLSALSGLPIKQTLAVTGSVNQLGQVQAIGGVNEKIEGFFDVCRSRGLTGDQGVLIPSSNVKHLMLRGDVVQAAEEGKFHVYAVDTVDQAITLLTGAPAGEPDDSGSYPADTVNYLVDARLAELSQIARSFAQEEKGPSPDE